MCAANNVFFAKDEAIVQVNHSFVYNNCFLYTASTHFFGIHLEGGNPRKALNDL